MTVRDGGGSVLATTDLGSGTPAGPIDLQCLFNWSVSVGDSEFYVIEVGDRGDLTFSAADLEEQGWAVEMQIGE